MKRLFLASILIFVCVLSIMTSCKKYYSTTDTQVLQALTDTFSISASDTSWKKNSNGYFVYTDSLSNIATYDSTGAESDNTNINDSGAVFIYFSVDTGKSYRLLPVFDINNYNFSGISSDGIAKIVAAPISASTAAPNFQVNIKVVSIPSIIAPETINYDPHDYEEVKKAFHLQE